MNEQSIKVLLVEDEPSYVAVIEMVLMDLTHPRFELHHAARLGAGIECLQKHHYDIALLDLVLPDSQGIATYMDAQAAAPGLPMIVLTGMDDQKLALQAVRQGAQDFLVKGQIEGKMLGRVIRYAIERKKSAEALRQSEEFFRLISESVTDLIAVLDCDGRRLYNSPSYAKLLRNTEDLTGTDSFEQIHPDDRALVRIAFQKAVQTGQSQRCTYRLLLAGGELRYIESQGSVIQDATGRPCKVVVVSRDITEHKEAVSVLRNALADLKRSHEELKRTQLQLIQAEKLEAISTFASGVAHEVKNPLQTVILGVDYLSNQFENDPMAAMILGDMGSAVQRADDIIKGLLEFSAYKKRDVRDENLSHIIEMSLHAVESELANNPIQLRKDLTEALPLLRLDLKTMKHVFINLFMYCIREMALEGGILKVRTYAEELKENYVLNGRSSTYFKAGEVIVVAEVEDTGSPLEEPGMARTNRSLGVVRKEPNLGITVLKKIIELYGGIIQVTSMEIGNKYTITFKATQAPKTL
jgi:two-component system cell cycle sensor histidine kinase/response regulator CckA